MDCNIILNALKESVDYIKKLDEIRGELVEDTLEPINTFENVNFERDYKDANMFLDNGYHSLRIFESGFDEFMSSEIPAKYEKTYLLSQILIISRTCDNLVWFGGKQYEIVIYESYDEKTSFDDDWRIIDNEYVWCKPDLESYKTLFKGDRNLDIFYNYSYYIISIAERISDVVKKHLLKGKELKRGNYSKTGFITEIDVEKLREFFVRDFRDKKEDVSGFHTLIIDLQSVLFNKREITAIASIIYNGKKFHPFQKENLSFSKWLRAFSKIIGVETPNNKECQVKKEIKTLSKKFYYLRD